MAKGQRKMKKTIVVILLSGSIGLILTSCGTKPPLVKTIKIEQKTIIASLLVKGKVITENKTPIYAQADGRIGEVLVELNQRVAQHQKLLVFDENTAQSSLAQAELRLEAKKNELGHAEEAFLKTMSLHETKEVDKSQLESDQEWYKNTIIAKKMAENDVKLAQSHLQNLVYYSPQSGVVIENMVNNNQFVNANDLLLTVANLSKLAISFEIKGQEASFVKADQDVTITKTGTEKKFKGYIKSLSPKNEYAEPAICGIIYLNSQSMDLALGDETDITVITQKKDNAFILSSNVIYKKGNQNYVFLYQNGIVKKRVVRVGVSNARETEIIFGLHLNDEVILPSNITIESGMKVRK